MSLLSVTVLYPGGRNTKANSALKTPIDPKEKDCVPYKPCVYAAYDCCSGRAIPPEDRIRTNLRICYSPISHKVI